MAHTYASVTEFKRAMVEGGTDYGTTSDADLLLRLEGASRRVDGWCGRSRFGSGFGPRLGTNVYDADSETRLYLADDLLSYTSGTVAGQTGGTGVAVTETTDFYLEPSSATQKRWLRVHGLTSVTIGAGYRIWSLVGKWGYQDERTTSASVTGEALDASETGVDVGSGSDFGIGQTILVDSEQMYVTAIASNTLTVVRGANGTTAATHLTSAAIAVYDYPREAKDATLQIAMRRWRSREAGLVGEFGGGSLPIVAHRDSEASILRALVGHLRVYGVG